MKKQALALLLALSMMVPVIPAAPAKAADAEDQYASEYIAPETGDILYEGEEWEDNGIESSKTYSVEDNTGYLNIGEYTEGEVVDLHTNVTYPLALTYLLDTSTSMGKRFVKDDARYAYKGKVDALPEHLKKISFDAIYSTKDGRQLLDHKSYNAPFGYYYGNFDGGENVVWFDGSDWVYCRIKNLSDLSTNKNSTNYKNRVKKLSSYTYSAFDGWRWIVILLPKFVQKPRTVTLYRSRFGKEVDAAISMTRQVYAQYQDNPDPNKKPHKLAYVTYDGVEDQQPNLRFADFVSVDNEAAVDSFALGLSQLTIRGYCSAMGHGFDKVKELYDGLADADDYIKSTVLISDALVMPGKAGNDDLYLTSDYLGFDGGCQDAVAAAYRLKQAGITVYTCSLANSTVSGMRNVMRLSSSAYPNARGTVKRRTSAANHCSPTFAVIGYVGGHSNVSHAWRAGTRISASSRRVFYIEPNNEDDIEKYIKEMTSDITSQKPKTTLGTDSVLKDFISESFEVVGDTPAEKLENIQLSIKERKVAAATTKDTVELQPEEDSDGNYVYNDVTDESGNPVYVKDTDGKPKKVLYEDTYPICTYNNKRGVLIERDPNNKDSKDYFYEIVVDSEGGEKLSEKEVEVKDLSKLEFEYEVQKELSMVEVTVRIPDITYTWKETVLNPVKKNADSYEYEYYNNTITEDGDLIENDTSKKGKIVLKVTDSGDVEVTGFDYTANNCIDDYPEEPDMSNWTEEQVRDYVHLPTVGKGMGKQLCLKIAVEPKEDAKLGENVPTNNRDDIISGIYKPDPKDSSTELQMDSLPIPTADLKATIVYGNEDNSGDNKLAAFDLYDSSRQKGFNAAAQTAVSAPGYMFAGRYADKNFTNPLKATETYKDEASLNKGTSMDLRVAHTYYVRAISDDYLTPKVLDIKSGKTDIMGQVIAAYMFFGTDNPVDKTYYKSLGYYNGTTKVDCGASSLTEDIKIVQPKGTTSLNIATTANGLAKGSLVVQDISIGAGSFRPYMETFDGVVVKSKTVKGMSGDKIKLEYETKSPGVEYEALVPEAPASFSLASARRVSSLTLAGDDSAPETPVEKTEAKVGPAAKYRLTKVKVKNNKQKVINKIRFYGVVDTKTANKYGFVLKINGKVQKHAVKKSYKKVAGLTAKSLFGKKYTGQKIYYYDLKTKNLKKGSVIEIKPYWVSKAGTTYGKARTFKYGKTSLTE